MRRASRNERVIRRAGGGATAVIRRSHSLADHTEGEVLADLRVSGNHLAGAATVTLTGDSLSGAAVSGMQLTIGATAYTVAADATAAGGSVSVTLTSGLVAPAADGAAVTISRAYGDTTWIAFQPVTEAEEGNGENAERLLQGARIHLAIGENEGVEVLPGHLCIFAGKTQRIQTAALMGGARWVLTMGEGA